MSFTTDPFAFETSREGRAIRCICRRNGREASVQVKCDDPASIRDAQVKKLARSWWLAAHRRSFFGSAHVSTRS